MPTEFTARTKATFATIDTEPDEFRSRVVVGSMVHPFGLRHGREEAGDAPAGMAPFADRT